MGWLSKQAGLILEAEKLYWLHLMARKNQKENS